MFVIAVNSGTQLNVGTDVALKHSSVSGGRSDSSLQTFFLAAFLHTMWTRSENALLSKQVHMFKGVSRSLQTHSGHLLIHFQSSGLLFMMLVLAKIQKPVSFSETVSAERQEFTSEL